MKIRMKGGIHMTSNQINYFRALEDQRSHKESEYNTRVANQIAEKNAASNAINASANERNSFTNILGAAIDSYVAQVGARRADIDAYNATINARNADIRYQELLEKSRSNQFYEGETYRHNLETEMYNRDALFEQRDYHNNLLAYNYAELANKNAQLWEQQRSNIANESLKQSQHNLDVLIEEHDYDIRQRQLKHQNALFEEEQRHNIANENMALINAISGGFSNLSRAAALIAGAM